MALWVLRRGFFRLLLADLLGDESLSSSSNFGECKGLASLLRAGDKLCVE